MVEYSKIKVIGKGFLGKEFERQGFEVLDRSQFDVTRLRYVWENLSHCLEGCDVVINCIGKADTRWCENRENYKELLLVNAQFVNELSKWCEMYKVKLVHISTGCLYDRYDIENKEEDFLVAHCNYTVSKWTGELGCNLNRDLILRPRLYFSDIEDKGNLLCKLPKFDNYLTVPNSYTRTSEIVNATKALLENDQAGIFNVACDGNLTLEEVAERCNLSGGQITPAELCESQKLYLVNNVLCLDKLKQFYKPQRIEKAIDECWAALVSIGTT